MSYVDIAIIALVVLCGLIGLWKGFFKTFIGMFGGIIALLLAIFLAKPVSEACIDGFAQNFVLGESGSIRMFVGGLLPDALKELGAASSVTTEMFTEALGGSIFGFLLKPFAGLLLGNQMVQAAATVYDGITVLIAYQIFAVIVGVALFIVARLLMCLFTMFAKSFLQDKKVSGLSRLLGAVLGVARGALYACVLLLLASFMTGFPFMSGYNADLEKSVLAKNATEFVVKIPDKIFSSDEDLFGKLLDRAGLIKDGEDDGYEMTEAESQLKADFDGAIPEDVLPALLGTADVGNDMFNQAVQALYDYNRIAADNLASTGVGNSGEAQTRCEQLHAAMQDLSETYTTLKTELAAYVAEYAELSDPQKSEKMDQIQTALDAIVSAYNENGIADQFGAITIE